MSQTKVTKRVLHTYLAGLKTIEVVLITSPNSEVVELGRRWLPRHFQPTEVGLPPTIASQSLPLREIGTSLNYPHGSTARVFTELSPDITSEVRDAIVLSSCYIAPLLVLGDDCWERLAPYALWLLRSTRVSEESETLRVLHLAQLAAVKLFPYAHEAFHTITDYSQGELQRDVLDILLEKRRILVSQEVERVFSGLPKDERGRPFVFVADPLHLISHWITTMKRQVIAQLPWDDFVSTGLGFAVGIVVTTDALKSFLHEATQRERREVPRRHLCHRHR